MTRLELASEAPNQAADVRAQHYYVLQRHRPSFAEHYREGLVQVHIHVRARPEAHPEPHDFCAIFHHYPSERGDVQLKDGIGRGKDWTAQRRGRARWIEHAVLISVAQLAERTESTAGYPSVVWLNPLNHCPVARFHAAQPPFVDLAIPRLDRITDRKLGAIAGTASELTHKMVQGRAKVVGYVADDCTDDQRRIYLGLVRAGREDDAVPAVSLWLYVGRKTVRARIREGVGLGLETAQVLPGSLDLLPASVETVRHA